MSTPDPELPHVQMHLATPANAVTGTVVSTERCTASRKAASFVRHVAIDVSGTVLAKNFRAGQSFGVLPPGVDAKGLPHKLRLYSIASPTVGEDGAGHVLATTVKRTIDEHWDSHGLFLGVASNFLCDLRPGDPVRLTGPNGKRFLLPARPDGHDFVFFATGTGIAPFRGMIRELLATAATSRIVLVMGSPYASDLLYHDEMQALAAAHPRFVYLTAVSRETQADGGGPMYVQDRLRTHRGLFESILGSDRGLVYVCGLAGMEMGVLRGLSDTLPAAPLAGYLAIDEDLRGIAAVWERKMLHRQVRTTRRVFLEVY